MGLRTGCVAGFGDLGRVVLVVEAASERPRKPQVNINSFVAKVRRWDHPRSLEVSGRNRRKAVSEREFTHGLALEDFDAAGGRRLIQLPVGWSKMKLDGRR